jgi:DNA-binding IclR family transcriptional regulator
VAGFYPLGSGLASAPVDGSQPNPGIAPARQTVGADADRSRCPARPARQVKKKGHAVSDGENAYGLRTLATPIFDAQGHVIGGLSVTVDAMRMDMAAFRDRSLPRLMQVTAQVQDLAIKSGLRS